MSIITVVFSRRTLIIFNSWIILIAWEQERKKHIALMGKCAVALLCIVGSVGVLSTHPSRSSSQHVPVW